jgi:hypothetical protein
MFGKQKTMARIARKKPRKGEETWLLTIYH